MMSLEYSSRRAPLCRLGCLLLLACILVIALAPSQMHAYRKPPFNGSIFGKRADADSRTLAALCEVAVDACSGWFSGTPGETN